MELIERDGFLTSLRKEFQTVVEGEGHCVFISGEAGIGKSSLLKVFCKEIKDRYTIYHGTCDALFTPRPLAPVYDILLQLKSNFPENSSDIKDRTVFFTRIFQELANQKEASVIVFEDIHWADEATLDFIKFLARRITQLQCFFILSYRDNEIHSRHPLRNVLGQLNPGSFTRMQLTPLSKEAVEKMAAGKGYSGEDVYMISGGNPFYVTEILSNYSLGVPDNIKDSIISAYNRLEEKTKQVWELLSVIPDSLEIKYLEKFEPLYATAIERCVESRILFLDGGFAFFKHELFRRAIEISLSPLKRVALNKRILELFLESFEQNHQIERIVHHAKNANEYELVSHYAPIAAQHAASVGAHTEACRLYLSAIEYYQGKDTDTLIRFYDAYAYECYLTNQMKEAIIYTGKSLDLWKKKNDTENIGNNLRFLSRLWWFDGNRTNATSFANQAIEVLDKEPSSRAKAMAISNMAQLKMLSEQLEESILWGEKAIAIAKELNDEETLSHALNNMGSVKMCSPDTREEGLALLQQSLAIAIRNSYHEHAARAYTNLGHSDLELNRYSSAEKILEEGIQYCEERDLDSWKAYMSSGMCRLKMETGYWNEALQIANGLLQNEYQTPIIKATALVVTGTIKMRKGDTTILPILLEAKTIAFQAMELQRLIPALVALLEYEWLTGERIIEEQALDGAINMMSTMGHDYKKSKFSFWLWKARKQHLPLKEMNEGYSTTNVHTALRAASVWEKAGCAYEQALALFDAGEDDKRKAITLVHGLGANAVYEKMKLEMRTSGIKSIPRGIRKTTQSNPALLTDRELDVLQLLQEGMQNKEIAGRLFISAKTVDHHISAILYKLEVKSRVKAVQEAIKLGIIK